MTITDNSQVFRPSVLAWLDRYRAAKTTESSEQPTASAHYDCVDEASDESFPCSDPPAWTPITGIRMTEI